MRFARVIVTLAALVAAGTQAFAGSAKFATTVTYPVGSDGANSVVSVDVNGDTFPDIIVATNNGVSVLVNNGDGTYGSPTTYATGGPLSNALVVTDVNGDGLPDIVVTNMCTTTTGCWGVSVLLNNPANPGTFQSENYNSGGLETGGVAVGDVNGDGFPDLVLTSNCQPQTCAGGDLTLLLGNGDGTFQPFILIADNKGPVAIGDMNNDGIPDLVTGAGVMLGNGDGTFQAAISTVAGGALSIALADVNGDGNLDVVSAIPTGVAVQLGNGTGNLAAQTNYTTGGKNPLWIAIADFNGDNYPDVAVVNECVVYTKQQCTGSANVGVLAGNGDGTLKPAMAFLTGGEMGTSISAADVNQDGKIDLVALNVCVTFSNCTTGSVGVLMNEYVTSTVSKITSSLNPAVINQQVTFTATVTGVAGGSGPPDGSEVDFFDGSNDMGPAFTVHGVATFTTSLSTAGVQVIKAVYSGDTYHNASSGSLVETVEPYATTVSISSSLNPSNYGQSVTFTAQVVSSGGNIPTGTVTFKNGTAYLGLGTLNGSGIAVASSHLLPVGTNNITATYNGDSLDGKSTSSALPQTVNQAQLTMTLTSSANPSPTGKLVKFTATLASNGGLPISGTVTFSYNGSQLGTAPLTPSSVAVFSTKALPFGSDLVTASYTGNTDFSDASASITQVED